MSVQMINDAVQQHIERLNDLHHVERDLISSVTDLKKVQDERSREIGYWDGFVNYLPRFISAVVAMDYEKLSAYNKVSNQIAYTDLQIQDVRCEKNRIISQIYNEVTESKNADPEIKLTKCLLNHIAQMESFSEKVLASLKRAENSEWWDGHTSDRTFYGAMNDFESRRDNFNAAHLLQVLNNQIRQYNEMLMREPILSEMGTFEIRPLPELYGAGESIVDAELNESNPLYYWAGNVGDMRSSANTLNVIRSVLYSVQSLNKKIRNQREALTRRVDNYVLNILKDNFPNIVLYANLDQIRRWQKVSGYWECHWKCIL